MDGVKTYEVRENDRGYQVGDVLVLNEWEPAAPGSEYAGHFTGRSLVVEVLYMTPGGAWGLPPSLRVMGFRLVPVAP